MSDARAAWVTLAAALAPIAVVSLWAWIHPIKVIFAGLLAVGLFLGIVP